MSHAGTCQVPFGRDPPGTKSTNQSLKDALSSFSRTRVYQGSALMEFRYTNTFVVGSTAVTISACCSSSSSQFMGPSGLFAQSCLAFDH